jgi:hypothetical protein
MGDNGGKAFTLGVDWPGRPLPMMPGDFNRIVPHGMALGITPVVRASDNLARAMNVPNYYGLEPVSTDPVLAAPTQYPNGGVIYFDSGWKWEIIEAALSLIAVRFNEREFGIFQGEAREPIRDRYLDQVRIASKDALIELFRVGTGIRQIPDQPIPIGAYIQQFFREQGRSGIIQTSAELPVGTATGPRKGSHSDSSWKTSIGASTACGAVHGY